MKGKLILKIMLGVVAFAILLLFAVLVFAGPWIERKILSTLNNNDKGYHIKAAVVQFSLATSSLELKNISIRTIAAKGQANQLNGEIASVNPTCT